ncbi:DEAD/DEAH box helicase [Alkalicoccus urumqiensis]|uniref:ATP-dependent helicase n=1 Tax=Alkalicoccus urumqiensis TaxID=1548213 RepID=A0A2P6MDT0_ALKUR|nr:DEAD/DEAH box helicase [Alkalicoccus urumqiensis]PRO64433.1 ATP-dependent helicase [Alkalicoccus urumqiensis]
MFRKRTFQELIDALKNNENISYWHEIAPVAARYAPMPETVPEKLKAALKSRGIDELYTHQAEAFQAVQKKENIVTVTPTASGKTLCYNLPVLSNLAANPNARALYLFPTKALSQDQRSELDELIEAMESEINSFTYDGDTPSSIRQHVRRAGHIVITNPDMLHSAILPHHTKWISLFENLETVVIDELHTYRGVFGSHVANVIRRLKRLCRYYGSDPVFISTSATIANPKELAEQLTGEKASLINTNGAPSGKKHIAFFNPPIVNEELRIRQSPSKAVQQLALSFLKERIQTIVFARSRVRVEVILSRIQAGLENDELRQSVRGYRGGYLPNQRREIERTLRTGETLGVISTNALELGVDIGQLQVCILTGYPGSIASSWQQAGRAGRRQNESLVILAADSSPVDQYVFTNPSYFFESSPETARLNKNNVIILADHIKCAVYELPFAEGEPFDDLTWEDTAGFLEYLSESRVLHERSGKWYWMNDAFPAHNISLRSAAQENVVIIDQSIPAKNRVIGEMDTFSALTLLHDEAIYLHEGIQFQVELLDWDEKKAYVREVSVDYFTDANLAVKLTVLEIDEEKELAGGTFLQYGDVMVSAMATLFKKIKLDTFENVGSGPIHLPEQELHSTAVMLEFSEEAVEALGEEEVEQVLLGLAHVWQHVACVHVMCDKGDLFTVPQVKSAHAELPTIFLYDRYPGGIGLSDKIYKEAENVLEKTRSYLSGCPCDSGCPSCTGMTAAFDGINVKHWAARLLENALYR